jgi:RNA polymerase sigma-70 factor (ECF subfamily)
VLLAFAQRGVGSEQDAEDVAQEVFLKLCAQVAEFDRTRDAVSWAFSIAAYEVMTHRRRVRRRREVSDHDLAGRDDGRDAQEDELMQRQLLGALAAAIGELTDTDRAALGLVTNQSAANEPATSATRRKRRERALGRLRAVWRSLYGGS